MKMYVAASIQSKLNIGNIGRYNKIAFEVFTRIQVLAETYTFTQRHQ